MTARVAAFVVVAVATCMADAPDETRPAQPADWTIRWVSTGRNAVEVDGIDALNLGAFSKAEAWGAERWALSFRVSVIPDKAAGTHDTLPMAGSYRVVGKVLRFEPRFPFEPGMRYRARFSPRHLPAGPNGGADLTSELAIPAPAPSAPAVVSRVDPVADRLPENLLKFYLHFSKPMSRGKAYGHIRILDAADKPLKMPFLELGEELWDPSGTRLTVLLDPGRIKRELRPREEEGPILEAGKTYTLVIDREWPDAAGQPLREAFRKPFRAGPADETQPDPKTWRVEPPVAGSRDALMVNFPEPLDRAILDRAIDVHDPDGRVVPGQVDVPASAARWLFKPEQPWRTGTYQLVIDTELEDLAGNNIARPFEVDLFQPITRAKLSKTATLPVVIQPNP